MSLLTGCTKRHTNSLKKETESWYENPNLPQESGKTTAKHSSHPLGSDTWNRDKTLQESNWNWLPLWRVHWLQLPVLSLERQALCWKMDKDFAHTQITSENQKRHCCMAHTKSTSIKGFWNTKLEEEGLYFVPTEACLGLGYSGSQPVMVCHPGTMIVSPHLPWPCYLCRMEQSALRDCAPALQPPLCMGLLLPQVFMWHLGCWQLVGSLSLVLQLLYIFKDSSALDANLPRNTQPGTGDPRAAWISGNPEPLCCVWCLVSVQQGVFPCFSVFVLGIRKASGLNLALPQLAEELRDLSQCSGQDDFFPICFGGDIVPSTVHVEWGPATRAVTQC